MKLEEKLVSLRKAKGLSQMKLAEMMNVSRQAISRWEVGAAVPSTDNLKFLGQLYGVPLEYLLHEDALEPVCVAEEPNKGKSKKCRRNVLLLVAVGIAVGIVVVVLCLMLFGRQGEEPIPMENMEGSDMVTVDEFEMVW